MKSFKHRLELNNEQTTLAFQHAGVSRHAYNWGVSLCNDISEKKEKLPSSIDLHKLLVRDIKSANPWYYEVSKCSPQQALRDLITAWSNYFTKLRKGEIEKMKKAYIKECTRKGREVNQKKLFAIGKPKFHKKGVNDSFYLEGNIRIKDNKIKVPIFGWIKMSESYCEGFTVKNVVISRTANHFFISFKRERADTEIKGIENMPSVGVDLGVKVLATLSDGQTFGNPKAFKKYKRKLAKAQRVVSRRFNENSKKQSNNYKKAKNEVAKIHYKIACVRKDAIHKLTSYLAKNHSEIKIEDLNIKGMLKNHRLAGAIQDSGFFECRRQLEYKTKWYGSKVTVIDRFFASSKTCSCCGHIKEDLTLKDRIFICDLCGLRLDRDLNASININNYSASSADNACGESNKPINVGTL